MNVGELIEKLQELNPNLPVYFTGNGTGVWFASDLEVDEHEYYGEVCMIYHQVVEMKVRELIKILDELDSDEQEKEIMFSDWERGPLSVDGIEEKSFDEYCNFYLIY